MTSPANILEQWAAEKFRLPDAGFHYDPVDAKGRQLKSIPYKELDLSAPWESFDLKHQLTNQGIEKFVADYKSTLAPAA